MVLPAFLRWKMLIPIGIVANMLDLTVSTTCIVICSKCSLLLHHGAVELSLDLQIVPSSQYEGSV